jgi:hypothetical protein
MPPKKSSTSSSVKKSSSPKDKSFVPIDPGVREAENARCSEWIGDEENCRANKCWYYRNSKKCAAHLGILSGKSPKGSKKKRSKRRSQPKKLRRSRKGSKKSGRRRSRRSKKY